MKSGLAEKAILVGLMGNGCDREEAEESILELSRLCQTAGAATFSVRLQARRRPDPASYVGAGLVTELAEIIEKEQVDLVVFDGELKPSQQRNLEKMLGCKVLDRTQVILDVFARRARTMEGKLQVELAQLDYLLPRLVGMGDALSKLGGGIGTRGPGETKLESDRQRLRNRITQLKREMEGIARTRKMHRDRRDRQGARTIALVGYTNAGKSSLFNALTNADVVVRDQLFATLDPTVRALPVEAPQGQGVLMSDTVGFIRRLPHALVASFRATLEEVKEASLRLVVVDASDPALDAHLATIAQVLEELLGGQHVHASQGGGRSKGEWLVLNKWDRLSTTGRQKMRDRFPNAFRVSSLKGTGLKGLASHLRRRFGGISTVAVNFVLPAAQVGLLAKHYAEVKVLSRRWKGDQLAVSLVGAAGLSDLKPFRVKRAAKAAL